MPQISIAATATLQTFYGQFQIYAFNGNQEIEQSVALLKGPAKKNLLVRIHSECLTGDVFKSLKCDCGEQLDKAMQIIQEQGGVLIYLPQEGRGIGLKNKIRAYALQEHGYDTVEANFALGFPDDMRTYSLAADILKLLGVTSIRLITNNPRKIQELHEFGITVSERVPLIINSNDYNRFYLETKMNKFDHMLELE